MELVCAKECNGNAVSMCETMRIDSKNVVFVTLCSIKERMTLATFGARTKAPRRQHATEKDNEFIFEKTCEGGGVFSWKQFKANIKRSSLAAAFDDASIPDVKKSGAASKVTQHALIADEAKTRQQVLLKNNKLSREEECGTESDMPHRTITLRNVNELGFVTPRTAGTTLTLEVPSNSKGIAMRVVVCTINEDPNYEEPNVIRTALLRTKSLIIGAEPVRREFKAGVGRFGHAALDDGGNGAGHMLLRKGDDISIHPTSGDTMTTLNCATPCISISSLEIDVSSKVTGTSRQICLKKGDEMSKHEDNFDGSKVLEQKRFEANSATLKHVPPEVGRNESAQRGHLDTGKALWLVASSIVGIESA